jgi:hypothetical protein
VSDASLAAARTAAAGWDRLARAPIGADDAQSNALGKLVPVAVAYAGDAGFAAAVEASIRATQDNDDAVGWLLPVARMIEAAVTGAATTGGAAVAAGLPHFSDDRGAAVRAAVASAAAGGDVWDAVAALGSACAVKNTVPVIAYILSRHGGDPDYATAVRENAGAGGDSAARACAIGAILAAARGADSVPAEWLAAMDAATRARALDAAAKLAPAAPPGGA